MTAGKNFNALALGCVCTTLVAMDGPLLQRASSVQQVVPQEPGKLDVAILPELPAHSTGTVDYSFMPVQEPLMYSNRFWPIYEAYQHDWPISGAISGCDGTCIAIVWAPALALDYCVSHEEHYGSPEFLNSTESIDLYFKRKCLRAESDKSIFRTMFQLVRDVTSSDQDRDRKLALTEFRIVQWNSRAFEYK